MELHWGEYSETCIKWPLNFVVSQDWWSHMTERMNMILCQATDEIYRQVSNIRRTLAGNKFVDHSDVVGASPVGTAPTSSSFST